MIWTWLYDLWPFLLGVLSFALAASATIHIVLQKHDSRAAIGWAGLVWLAPLIGSAAYLCFGINRIQRKAVALQFQSSWRHHVQGPLLPSEMERRTDLATRYPNLVGLETLGRNITGHSVLPGNRVEPLVNGDEAYPAMIEAIDRAAGSVSLLSYIFDNDRAGDAFFNALVRARGRGVEIRVLIDDVGSGYRRPTMVERLQEAGITADVFLPTRVPRLFKYANLRNHRKILVVDGRVGFTGGTNIREAHWLALEPKSPVECVHFRVEGPVVQQMQEIFALDWAFAHEESLSGERWFPEIDHVGPIWARGIPDGPDEDFEKLTQTLVGALSVATETVRIVTPYFLPEAGVIHALNVTALRGVDVQILIPSRNNIPFVAWASASLFWQLLEKKCRIFLTPPPFDHTKLLTVDGVWSLIGSTNWDPRSLRLNFEFNVECYDEQLAVHLNQIIDRKTADAREVTLEDAHNRSLPVKLRDGLARLMTPYL